MGTGLRFISLLSCQHHLSIFIVIIVVVVVATILIIIIIKIIIIIIILIVIQIPIQISSLPPASLDEQPHQTKADRTEGGFTSF